jgi:hypothetical protein
MEERDIEDIVEQILERHRDGDREITETVMYFFLLHLSQLAFVNLGREILREQRDRKVAQGFPADIEIQREIRVKQMLEPTNEQQSYVPEHNIHTPPQYPSFNTPQYQSHQPPAPIPLETPVVDILPQAFSPFGAPQYVPQYVPETTLKNKRGSRRDSLRPTSRPSDISSDTPEPIIHASQTLEAFMNIRTKLQHELSTIPISIRVDIAPSSEERKTLQHHMLKLEDILNEVDAVALPTDSADDITRTRSARREIVADIVAAIDGIEKHIQPGTPDAFSGAEVSDTETREEVSDGEENSLIDLEIQRVIRETLARKKDEEVVVSSRRSVTVEDVPDVDY